MSSTVTATTTITPRRTPQTVLQDYKIHHSGDSQQRDSTASSTPEARTTRQNPPNWDTAHRRVPPYRPINTERDQSEVRVYLSQGEHVFVNTMFTGVYLHSAAAKLWRRSFGRFAPGIFRYGVGGEF